MKQGWEIKKLGEVCNLYQPKTISGEMLIEDGKYLVYGANGVIGRYNQYNHENSEVLLTCRGATCGTINMSAPYSWINGNAMVVQPKTDNITKQFLALYLQSVDWKNVITGAAQPQITRQSLSPLTIEVPPREEQERIVAELDCLSGIIERKREQLKQLDELARSIFYQMFGDPITNEKGWEIKKLGEVCDVRDGTHDSPKYLECSDYVLITSKNITNDGNIDFSTANYISKEDYESINKRSYVESGDIIMAMIGTIGKPIIVKETDKKFCIKNVALIKFGGSTMVLNTYIQALLNNTHYGQYIQSQNKGGTQKFVALGTIRNLTIPLPPMEIQQQFANKINEIEKLKTQIKQSIKDTEELFNSRMNFYFN